MRVLGRISKMKHLKSDGELPILQFPITFTLRWLMKHLFCNSPRGVLLLLKRQGIISRTAAR